jgi:hypothetical protein
MNIWLLNTLLIATQILSSPPDKKLPYLDPGSGSFIFQMIIATLLGAAFVIKVYWKRIIGFFQRIFSRHPKDTQE